MFLAIYNAGYGMTFVLIFKEDQVSICIFDAAATASRVRFIESIRDKRCSAYTRVIITSSPIYERIPQSASTRKPQQKPPL